LPADSEDALAVRLHRLLQGGVDRADWPTDTIARHLNAQAVPTSRGVQWHHETARRLLKRLRRNGHSVVILVVGR
jgi:hypothetical protein